MRIELFGVADEARLAEALAVRMRVFVAEQSVPIDLEIDEYDRADSRALHAIARDERGSVVATGRSYRRDASTVQIGRMAVDVAARGSGTGAAILRRLLDDARDRGFVYARLDAQHHAVGFYERQAFAIVGDAFPDAGIVHYPMLATIGNER